MDSTLAQLNRRSVARLREVVRSGGFEQLARVDPHTGETIDNEARALFAGLPVITPMSGPESLVDVGLMDAVPKGWHTAFETPKYRPGRQLFVRTTVASERRNERQPAGLFDAQGKIAFTHCATLKGQQGERFVVHVDGAEGYLGFRKSEIFAWNEPCGAPATGGTLSGIDIDYRAPRMRAFIAAALINIHDETTALDFSPEVLSAPERSKANATVQMRIVRRLVRLVDMHYPGKREGYAGPKAASLLGGGTGVCFVQRAVAGAFLQVFARSFAFEVQIAIGRTQRLGIAHGFNIITLLPTLDRFVSDSAWNEPLTELDVAFFGPEWGHNRRLEGFEGDQDVAVRTADVSLPQLRISPSQGRSTDSVARQGEAEHG